MLLSNNTTLSNGTFGTIKEDCALFRKHFIEVLGRDRLHITSKHWPADLPDCLKPNSGPPAIETPSLPSHQPVQPQPKKRQKLDDYKSQPGNADQRKPPPSQGKKVSHHSQPAMLEHLPFDWSTLQLSHLPSRGSLSKRSKHNGDRRLPSHTRHMKEKRFAYVSLQRTWVVTMRQIRRLADMCTSI